MKKKTLILVACILCCNRLSPVRSQEPIPRVMPVPPGPIFVNAKHVMPDGTFQGTTLTSAGLMLAPANGGYVITGTWTSPILKAIATPVWGRLSWDLGLGYAEELTNGDFETDADADGLPDGWTQDPDANIYITPALVTDGAYSGARFFRLTVTGRPPSGNLFAFHQEVAAEAGASYVLAAHVRCSPGFARTASATVHLTVRRNGSWYDSRAAYLKACYSDALNFRHGTDIWQPAQPVVFTLPDDGASYTLQVSLLFKPFPTSIAPQGYVDFDAVRLLRLPPTRVALQVRTSQDGQDWSDWSPPRYLHLIDPDTAFLLDPDFVSEGLALPNLDPRAHFFLPARHGHPCLQLRLTLSTDDPTRTPVVRSLHFDYAQGFPFLPPWDDTTDSVVNLHPFHPRFDAPAGRHGFVRTQGDRLIFENGTPARFWGAAYDVRYCWPEEQETIAARLAKFGFNLVKLTAVDGAWWNHGQNGCLDSFVAALRERGIYSYLQLASWAVITAMRSSNEARAFYTERYGTFPELQTFLDMGYDAGEKAWQLSLFAGDPKLTAFFQNYVTDVLTHVNPHTGLAYKDDPAVVLIELVNENYLTRRWASGIMPSGSLPDHYEALFDQGWHDWLRAHYASIAELKAAWDDGTGTGLLPEETEFDLVQRLPDRLGWPLTTFSRSRIRDLAQFYAERERAFYEEMAQFVHDLGVRVPVIASQHPTLLTEEWLALSPAVDVHDIHRYFDHPTGYGPAGYNVIRNLDPFLPVWAWHIFPYLGSTRLAGKPTSLSETNWALNNPHQYLLIPGLVGYASYAGIDNVVLFSYIHAGSPPQEPWEQIYLVPSVFRFHSNPLLLTATALASVAFRRGDVSPAVSVTDIRYSARGVRDRFLDHFRTSYPDLFLESGRFALKEATLTQGFHKRYAQPDPTQELVDGAPNAPDDTYVSDTGELTYSLGRRRFILDTPFTQAVAGHLAGEAIALSDLTVEGSWPEYAGVMITSLSEEPLRRTRSALIWAGGRVVNTGMWANEENTVPQDWGGEPILAEAVAVTVTLRTEMPFVKVYALDERGRRKMEVPVQKEPGAVTFILGGKYETLWYELTTGTKIYLPRVCRSSLKE